MADSDFEATDVVKFDVDTPEAMTKNYDRYDVGNTVQVKGKPHVVVWVDRDKGLAGVMRQ